MGFCRLEASSSFFQISQIECPFRRNGEKIVSTVSIVSSAAISMKWLINLADDPGADLLVGSSASSASPPERTPHHFSHRMPGADDSADDADDYPREAESESSACKCPPYKGLSAPLTTLTMLTIFSPPFLKESSKLQKRK